MNQKENLSYYEILKGFGMRKSKKLLYIFVALFMQACGGSSSTDNMLNGNVKVNDLSVATIAVMVTND